MRNNVINAAMLARILRVYDNLISRLKRTYFSSDCSVLSRQSDQHFSYGHLEVFANEGANKKRRYPKVEGFFISFIRKTFFPCSSESYMTESFLGSRNEKSCSCQTNDCGAHLAFTARDEIAPGFLQSSLDQYFTSEKLELS